MWFGKNYGTLDMSVEAQVERVRMCVAELGYSPLCIITEARDDDGCTFTVMNSRYFPYWVIWKARELSLVAEPSCYVCGSQQLPEYCEAAVRFVEDCGRDRTGDNGRPWTQGSFPRRGVTRP
jgi:hypothetical protein